MNILQQIIDMSNQGAFNQQQNDGTPVLTLNPETIIVQQEGEGFVVANADSDLDNSQYVIQYVTQQEGPVQELSMVEVQTDGVETAEMEGLRTEGHEGLHTEIHATEAT